MANGKNKDKDNETVRREKKKIEKSNDFDLTDIVDKKHMRRKSNRDRKAKRRKNRGEAENPSPELTVIEGRKPRRKRRSLIKIILRLALVALLVFAGVKIWQNWDDIAPDSFVVWINEKMGGGQSGSGYPVELTGSSAVSMVQARDGLLLLSDTDLTMYNHNGGELFRRQHGFSSPVMKTTGKWIILAENEGLRYRLETRGGSIYSGSTVGKIVSCDVDSKGNFALVTQSVDGYLAQVAVYDSKGKEKFKWSVSGFIPTDVTFTADEKGFAVCGIYAENGVMVSKVTKVSLSGEEPVELYKKEDMMLFSIETLEGGNFVSVGDRGAVVLNSDATLKVDHPYDTDIMGYSMGSGYFSVVLNNASSRDGGKVIVYSETGDSITEFNFDGEYRDVCVDKARTLLLTSKKVYSIDAKGNAKDEDINSDGRMISAFGSRTIVLALNELKESFKN